LDQRFSYDVDKIRADFPILARQVNGKPLTYLDNGASAQKPQVVIDAITNAYAHEYANVHRGLHYLSNLATDKYEAVRGITARFLGAGSENEIVFNSGTTEGINLVAYGWAMHRMGPGDEIILSVMEHHANIVPWHFLRERLGVVLKWVEVDSTGALDPQAVIDAITPNTKLVAITQCSNVLGTIVDVKAITRGAHELGVPVLVDGSQGAVHMPVDVQAIDCDFYVFTGHKLYGPSGVGVLYGKEALLDAMPPFLGGGEMISHVTLEKSTWAGLPNKFEAGTPMIAQAIGLGAAVDYVRAIGMDRIAAHEEDLRRYATQRLSAVPGLRIYGTAPRKAAVISFAMDGIHPHDIATVIDHAGVACRAGHHCAQPLMDRLGVTALTRASFGLYSTHGDADVLADALEMAREFLG